MIFSGKFCSLFHGQFPATRVGIFLVIVAFLPLALDARGFRRVSFGTTSSKTEKYEPVNENGYLTQLEREEPKMLVPFSPEPEVAQKSVGSVGSVASVPSFSGFLKRMEAQKAQEKAEAEMAATEKTGDSKTGTTDTTEVANSQQEPNTTDPRREIVTSTDSGLGTNSNYVFPRPVRNPVSADDLFLYFPIGAGDLGMLGMNVDIQNNSQFIPPQPMGLKSTAVFERVHK